MEIKELSLADFGGRYPSDEAKVLADKLNEIIRKLNCRVHEWKVDSTRPAIDTFPGYEPAVCQKCGAVEYREKR